MTNKRLQAPVTGKEILIETPHHQIAAVTYGSPDARPILALHGWLDNAASFALIAPLIRDHYIVAIDLPGHGHSSHYPNGMLYELFQNVFVIQEVANALGFSRYTLLGHSLGVVISTLVAAADNGRLERCVFLDGLGPLHDAEENLPARLRRSLDEYFSETFLTNHKVYAELEKMIQIRVRANHLSAESAQLLVERGVKQVEGGYQWRFDRRLLLPSPSRLTHTQVLSYLQAIDVPVLLLTASDSFLKTYPGLDERKQAIANLTCKEFAGDHHFHLQTPEPLAEEINAFLLQREQVVD